jgi:methionyl-tRNA synthetase
MAGELAEKIAAITGYYEAMEFRKAAAETRALWAAGNEYLTRAEPWVKYKSDVAGAAAGVRAGLNLCGVFALIATPLIPQTASVILDHLGVPEGRRSWPLASDRGLLDALPHGAVITPPPVLFAKIEDAQVAAWSARFGAGA